MTAYHEGGHALVALTVPAADPLHKVTIIPRGRALGLTMQLPERDKYSMSYEQMTSRLAILYGGRVAEELIFGKEKVTSGASNDISQATKLARAMVTKWGYSEAARHRRIRREPGGGVPRPLGGAQPERLGRHRQDHRRRGQAADPGRLGRGQAHPHREAGGPAHPGQGAAGVRDPQRRRDHRCAEGHPAAPRRAGDEAPPGPTSSVPLAPRPAAPIPIPPGAAPEPA